MTAESRNHETSPEAPGLKTVELGLGNVQLVPANVEVLNPESAARRSHLYFAWFVDATKPDAGNALDDSIRGKGLCHPFGYCTDYPDLYTAGRADVPVSRSRRESLEKDWLELGDLMAIAASKYLPNDAPWVFAFCLCDCLGREVQVGMSEIYSPEA